MYVLQRIENRRTDPIAEATGCADRKTVRIADIRAAEHHADAPVDHLPALIRGTAIRLYSRRRRRIRRLAGRDHRLRESIRREERDERDSQALRHTPIQRDPNAGLTRHRKLARRERFPRELNATATATT